MFWPTQDNTEVRAQQIAKIEEIRATRDEAACQAALAKLTESAALTESTSSGEHPMNLASAV